MKNICMVLCVFLAAFLEVAVLTVGNFTQYIDLLFITLFAVSPYQSGLREYLLLGMGGLLIESVSIAPFGMKLAALALSFCVGNFLLQTIFTRSSLYSLALFSLAISIFFNFCMFLINLFGTAFYASIHASNFYYIAFTIFADAGLLFIVLLFKTKNQKRTYSLTIH